MFSADISISLGLGFEISEKKFPVQGVYSSQTKSGRVDVFNIFSPIRDQEEINYSYLFSLVVEEIGDNLKIEIKNFNSLIFSEFVPVNFQGNAEIYLVSVFRKLHKKFKKGE